MATAAANITPSVLPTVCHRFDIIIIIASISHNTWPSKALFAT